LKEEEQGGLRKGEEEGGGSVGCGEG